MRLPAQPRMYDPSLEQKRSATIERELDSLRSAFSIITTGVGVPSFTPSGRAIYIRQDGGTNTTLYVYEGSAWVAK